MRFRSIEAVFRAFRELRVMVIGDVMVDSYVWGNVERISPEAPVQVVHVNKKEARLGGAGNVATNCLAIGSSPVLVSVTGKDEKGSQLKKMLADLGLDATGIIQSKKRKTISKERIIAGTQQLLRVDDEVTSALDDPDNDFLLARIKNLLPSCHLVIFEDYDKGLLGKNNIGEVIDAAGKLNIPVIVDPKKNNFSEYRKADLFKPNFKEIREGLNTPLEKGDLKRLKIVTRDLMKSMSLASVMVTLSENGIFYITQEETIHEKAHKREIADVSGAGDTVVSIAGLCYALDLPPAFTVGLSNLGGGIVCEHPGVVPVNAEKLMKEARHNRLTSYL